MILGQYKYTSGATATASKNNSIQNTFIHRYTNITYRTPIKEYFPSQPIILQMEFQPYPVPLSPSIFNT